MQNKPRRNWLMLLGIIGLVAFIISNWYPLFTGEALEDPQATQQSITKEEAGRLAVDHLKQAGADGELDSYVMLHSDMNLSGYLQRSDHEDAYIKQYNEAFPIDYYMVEIRSGERIWLVDVHMLDAKVISWQETTADLVPADLDAAVPLALDYADQLGYLASDMKLTEAAGRDPGHLVFNVPSRMIGEAILQVHVFIDGDSIVGFKPSFQVPDSYMDWYEDQRNWMDTIGLLSLGMYLLTAVAAIIFTVVYKDSITFKRGVLLSIIYLILSVVQTLNSYPVGRVSYPGMPDSEFVALFNTLFSGFFGLIIAFTLYLGLVSGEAAMRSFRLPVRSTADRDENVSMMVSMRRGYWIAFILLGAQGILYLVGEHLLGVWSINDPAFSMYNQAIPALFPLVAWVAAISEEAIYRVFGFALFKKLFRSTLVAILLSNMLWAMAHIGYPVFPAYTRFVEITLLGFLFSWAYLRYGFATAVFAHAIFDSILMGLGLMSMGGAGNALLSLFYIASPALVAYIIQWFRARKRPHRLPPETPSLR